jgi:hypothetical protein
MHIGMMGTRGARGNWHAVMDNALAAKMQHATQKSDKARHVPVAASGQSQSQALAKNRATLAKIRVDMVADMLKR